MSKYTVDYFLTKFTAIPEDKWCQNEYKNAAGQHCAFGLCGASNTIFGPASFPEEAKALDAMFNRHLGVSVPNLNDGHIMRFTQATPKQRILAGLKEIKNQSI